MSWQSLVRAVIEGENPQLHEKPRSDGGLNHISNRILLCGPCNRAKSNIYTLSGLRRLNKKNGWMA